MFIGVRARGWLCSMAVALSGCGGGAEPITSPGTTPAVTQSPPSGPPGAASPLALATRAPSEPARGARTGDAAPIQTVASSRFALALPTDASFVERALPLFAPERYASFRERSQLRVGQSQLQQLDLFPGGQTLLASSGDENSVRIYERSSKRLLRNIPIVGAERSRATAVLAWPELGAGGTPLFVLGNQRGLVLVSAGSGDEVALLAERPASALRWSPDRQVLVAVSSNLESQTSEVHFYRRAGFTLSALGSLNFEERVDGWDLSADNRMLAVSHYPSNDVRVIDLTRGADPFRIPGPRYAGDVAFSPDGRYLAVAGEGLLLVDLINSKRRAFYSYLYNSIGYVRFSPSGDAVVASAFDGRVRVFAVGEHPTLHLQLLQTLRHAGETNVYAFVFDEDGYGLSSASGDQTIRWFRGSPPAANSPAAKHAATAHPRRFRSLEQWQRDEPGTAKPWPEPQSPALAHGERLAHALVGRPRPSRLRSGKYACKISKLYRLRDCIVRRDANGHTLLSFAPDNLLPLEGIVYDDGPVVRFEGWLTEPSTIVDCKGCAQQSLHGVLRGNGTHFEGLLTFRNYWDPYVPPTPPEANVKIEEAADRFPLVLQFRQAEGPETTQPPEPPAPSRD
jgi:hypothetical protein